MSQKPRILVITPCRGLGQQPEFITTLAPHLFRVLRLDYGAAPASLAGPNVLGA